MGRIKWGIIGFVVGFRFVDEVPALQQQLWRCEDVIVLGTIVRGQVETGLFVSSLGRFHGRIVGEGEGRVHRIHELVLHG